MPQDASLWNRRELRRERSESVTRWRGSPSHQGGPRSFPRAAAEPRRHSGHGKQGGWYLYSEEPGRKSVHSRSISRTIPMHGDGKHCRFYRDNRGFAASREHWRGQSLEPGKGSFQMMLKQHNDGDILRDVHDKRNDANHLSPGQRVEERRLVDSVEPKLRRWKHKHGLPSRDSNLRTSSIAKSACSWVERNSESQPKTMISVQSSSDKDADYMFLTDQSEELTYNKKARLGWGEGLAKYEKKIVGCPLGSSLEGGDIESNLSMCLDAADRTSGDLRVLDLISSSLNSSFNMYDQMEKSGHDNLSNLPLPVSGSQMGHPEFSVDNKKLDTSSAYMGDLSLVQLPDDISLDSASALSISMDELLYRKDDVLKALLKTDSEIDFLENERRYIPSDYGLVDANSISGSFKLKEYARPSSGQDDIASMISQPPLPFVSSEDAVLGKMCNSNGTIPDFHFQGTFNMPVNDNQLVNEGALLGAVNEMVNVVSGSSRDSRVEPLEYVKFHGDSESKLCKLILPSKEGANEDSSNVFNNLFLSDHRKTDIAKVGSLYPLTDDSRIREKFRQRKRFLIFKERVLALKFKAFHHLWQEDMHLLSLRSDRLKSCKKLESSLRVKLGKCQKPPSSIFAHITSPGTMRNVSNEEIIHHTGKMLTDSCWRICREALKMPALLLDEREKIASRFISCNGLVGDPCAVEKERTLTNPWTLEEREIFLKMMGKHGKDFTRIASFLDHKTTADCIQFYYKNHKSDFFQGLKKNLHPAMHPRLPSVNTYMKTSGKMRNSEFNAVSLDILGESSPVASRDQAKLGRYELDQAGSTQNPCCTSGPSWVDSFDDEMEAIAADVLTKIRSSVVQVKSRREDFSDWSDVEKSKFIRAVSLFGKDFAKISQFLTTRSRVQCRAFFNKARKCLGLDSVLPTPGGTTLKSDASAGGHDMDCSHSTEDGPFICQNLSADDKDKDSLISVKMEVTNAIDCSSSTNLKEGACRNGSTRRQVFKEKCLRTSLKSHGLLHEMHVNYQVSDQSPRAVKKCSAILAADSSSCSVISLSSEFKDLSPAEIDQMEKPPLAPIPDASSFHCTETKTQNSDHQPGIWKQPSDDSDGNVPNLQELDRVGCGGGGFKLFGKRILTCMPSQKYPESGIHGKDKRVGAKSPQNLTGKSVKIRHSSVLGFNVDDHMELQNIPIRSYGFWDGTRVQTVPCLPISASLLARYPAAALSKHPLQEVATSSECNFDNSSSDSAIHAWGIAEKHVTMN